MISTAANFRRRVALRVTSLGVLCVQGALWAHLALVHHAICAHGLLVEESDEQLVSGTSTNQHATVSDASTGLIIFGTVEHTHCSVPAHLRQQTLARQNCPTGSPPEFVAESCERLLSLDLRASTLAQAIPARVSSGLNLCLIN
jgi:hypothetical protein